MKLKTKITFIGISLALGIAGAFYAFNKPRKDVAKKKPDYQLLATSLTEEYEANEQVANKKYLGKVLEVEGKVSSIEKGENHVINLVGSGFGNVRAEMTPDFQEKISNGQLIRIKGVCTGFLLDVVLTECSVIEYE